MISVAHAQEAAAAGDGGLLLNLLPVVIFIAFFYFLLILPQQRKSKRHRQMLDSLEKGCEVVTAGGVLGTVVSLHENFVTIDVGSGTNLILQKHSIQTLLPKGTIEGI